MIFTDAELTGLSAISGGGRLPGVPSLASGADQARLAMEGLRAKGVVDGFERVTRFGVVPVRCVELYRSADRHVFVNQMRVGVGGDEAVMVIHPAPGGWMLARMSPVALMVALLKAYPFLCGGGPNESPGLWEPVTVEQWAAGRPDDGTAPLLVVRDSCVTRRSWSMAVFDVRDGQGFEFDPLRRQGRVLPVWQVRARLAGLVGCVESEGLAGGFDGVV